MIIQTNNVLWSNVHRFDKNLFIQILSTVKKKESFIKISHDEEPGDISIRLVVILNLDQYLLILDEAAQRAVTLKDAYERELAYYTAVIDKLEHHDFGHSIGLGSSEISDIAYALLRARENIGFNVKLASSANDIDWWVVNYDRRRAEIR